MRAAIALSLITFISITSFAYEEQTVDPTQTLNLGRDFRRDHTTRYGDSADKAEKALNFDLESAYPLADSLEAIGNDPKQPKVVQSEALLLSAAVRGSISTRVRSNGGGAQGAKARKSIYRAYELNVIPREASIAYGEMMIALASEGRIARFFAAKAIGIDITAEARIALQWMKKHNATNELCYIALNKIYN